MAGADDTLNPAGEGIDRAIEKIYQDEPERAPWDRHDRAILAYAAGVASAPGATSSAWLRWLGHKLASPSITAIGVYVIGGLVLGTVAWHASTWGTGGKAPLLRENELLREEVADLRAKSIQAPVEMKPAVAPAAAQPVALTEIEQILSGFQCASLSAAVEGPGELTAKGFVASEADHKSLMRSLAVRFEKLKITSQVAVIAPPFCSVLGAVDDFLPIPVIGDPMPVLRLDNEFGRAYLGEGLSIEARVVGNEDAHAYVVMVGSDGRVVHLMPGPDYPDDRVRGDERLLIGDGPFGRKLEEPLGPRMLLLVQSESRLFEPFRPETETVETFLPALKQAIDAVPNDQRDSLKTALLFIDVLPPAQATDLGVPEEPKPTDQ